MFKVFIPQGRFYAVCVALVLALVCLLGRLYYLHILDHSRLTRIVENNRENMRTLYARRGNIVDRRGNLLASTREIYEVGLDPHSVKIQQDFEKFEELATILGVDVSAVHNAINKKTRIVETKLGKERRDVRWVELADAVDEAALTQIRALGVKGVYGNRKFERYYPSNEMAAHVLGFINKEATPVMGVERYLDFYLSGQDGWMETERDGRRRELAQFRSREVAPENGMHVELTVDAVIQHMIEKELKAIVGKYNPKAATIIVSEPHTGDVLSLANYPSYNPNRFWEYSVDHHRNRAVTDIMEPGSTFKIVTAAAALNEGMVTQHDRVDCSIDRVEYKGREVRLPKDHHDYAELSIRDLIVKSSNRGAAFLGMMLGEERLYDYASAFGFGKQTGYGVGYEENGILHTVDRWDGLTISRMPMGHAVGATPMQIHMAVSTIANNGILMKPRIVRRAYKDEGSSIDFDAKPVRRVVSQRTARIVGDILADVPSKNGTAQRAHMEGFEVAGKTGTTQKIIKGKYSREHHIASFVGFFPASNPAVVVSVFVDDPQMAGPGYGGVVAAPSFKIISEGIAQYMGIQPKQNGDKHLFAWKGDYFDWTNQ